jgi:hypothetical protein
LGFASVSDKLDIPALVVITVATTCVRVVLALAAEARLIALARSASDLMSGVTATEIAAAAPA